MEKRSIIITGCSSGIGAFCAQKFKEEGWVVIASARKPDDIARLQSDGFACAYLDYAEPESVDAFFDWAVSQTGGKVDALFNNGAYAQGGAVEDLPVEGLRAQFEANVFGWHQLTRRMVKLMRAQGYGRIVHNSSVLGLVPVPWRGAYAASKFAIEGLMLTLRQELSGSGIHISLIEPGPVPSRIAQNGVPHFRKHIDIENSVHREKYEKRLAAMETGGTDSKPESLEECFRSVLHAVTSQKPKPHYYITKQTRMAAIMKRILPLNTVYAILSKGA